MKDKKVKTHEDDLDFLTDNGMFWFVFVPSIFPICGALLVGTLVYLFE